MSVVKADTYSSAGVLIALESIIGMMVLLFIEEQWDKK